MVVVVNGKVVEVMDKVVEVVRKHVEVMDKVIDMVFIEYMVFEVKAHIGKVIKVTMVVVRLIR